MFEKQWKSNLPEDWLLHTNLDYEPALTAVKKLATTFEQARNDGIGYVELEEHFKEEISELRSAYRLDLTSISPSGKYCILAYYAQWLIFIGDKFLPLFENILWYEGDEYITVEWGELENIIIFNMGSMLREGSKQSFYCEFDEKEVRMCEITK